MVHVVWGLIIASGKTEQVSESADAAFLNLGDRPVLSYSIDAMERCEDIEGIAVVARKDRMQSVKSLAEIMGTTKLRRIVAGSTRRVASIKAALSHLDDHVTMVCIHDASRPFVTADQVAETVKTAKRYGCGVSARKMEENVKLVPVGTKVTKTIADKTAWVAETPQTYRLELLSKAIERAAKRKADTIEESELFDGTKQEVRIVPNEGLSLKINSATALQTAFALMKQEGDAN